MYLYVYKYTHISIYTHMFVYMHATMGCVAVSGRHRPLRPSIWGHAYAYMHIFEAGQHESWCADSLGLTVVKATDERLLSACTYMTWFAV